MDPVSFPEFRESARDLTVLAHADVLVAGGGPGGTAAAIAAARQGARVILVERFGAFGGTWTSGLLSSIMPFPFVRGLFAEVIGRLEAAGGWRPSAKEDPYEAGGHVLSVDSTPWGHGGTYDAETLKMVLDEMVVEAGVVPWFFLQIAGVFRKGNRVTGLVVESKEGRFAMTADYFIDATGDGDLCERAGIPTEYGRPSDGGVQPMTLMFKMAGVDDVRAGDACRRDPRLGMAWEAAKRAGEVTVPRENVLLSPSPRCGEWVFNSTRVLGKNGTKVRDVTEAMIEGRRQVREVAVFLRKYVPGFENARVSETAAHVGVRETRRVRCDHTLTAEDIVNGTTFPDGIARGSWYIDIHNPTGEGTEVRSPPPGCFYEIPFRCIRPQEVENVLVASRCLDCTHEAHAAVRITPQIVAIGQAAGTAAALCHQNRLIGTRSLDAEKLRTELRRQNAFV